MSNKAMSWAIDTGVKGSHKLVLMLLADAHNGHTGACFPSQEWIEDKSGLADSTVLAVLKDLESWGLVTRQTKALGRGKGSRRDIVLHMEILTPRNSDLLNSGDRPPKNTDLDPQKSGGPLKEEPEENRKEPEGAPARGSVGSIVDELWNAGPQGTRTKSSRKDLQAAVERVLKKRADVTGPALLDAYRRYLKSADVHREGGRYAMGVHRWIGQHRFDAFIGPPGLLAAAKQTGTEILDAARAERLDAAFWRYSKTGEWHGPRDGWTKKPDQAAPGTYPAELYAKYGLKPLAPARDQSSEEAA